jgi:hypothetical protein
VRGVDPVDLGRLARAEPFRGVEARGRPSLPPSPRRALAVSFQ